MKNDFFSALALAYVIFYCNFAGDYQRIVVHAREPYIFLLTSQSKRISSLAAYHNE